MCAVLLMFYYIWVRESPEGVNRGMDRTGKEKATHLYSKEVGYWFSQGCLKLALKNEERSKGKSKKRLVEVRSCQVEGEKRRGGEGVRGKEQRRRRKKRKRRRRRKRRVEEKKEEGGRRERRRRRDR